MMKHMMIVGCEIIASNEKHPDESIFKVLLQPLAIIKKTTRLESLIGGNMEDVIDGMLEHKKETMHDVIYMPLREWRDNDYKIAKHITVEVLPDETTGGRK